MTLPQHFLLIDDNVADHHLAQEAFGELCPECTLTCYTNGREALHALRRGTVQAEVILLDINMPVMNGFDVLRELKRDLQLVTLPVVMLSTSSNKGDVDMAYTLHASSYFVKATDFDGFIAQIDAFLAYWRQAQLAPKPV
ncbi:response regulator [Deinococcus hopiensis]|uniref:Response regulators consisting of a CheY-like receiver domain and a winged-helix DNA-binding domain n=1 Tax=Deinococcus hopiensis KR-140 TaxID=695939 RepID=A0A1W1UX63_9DEIO|nr:response regulator [Deinococcus hopiensis]SMB85630.1 Response regulators consisting of a CheY-like receiver domain and a winged-helix DNA-binding domain [Deinococcus hopiensis KR-140]